VVSDGAGSASLSKIGSHIVVRGFCRSALNFVKGGGRPNEIDRELAGAWLDDLRDRIDQEGQRRASPRRFFAATLVGCVVQPDGISVIHIGDGACAVRLRQELEWRVPSWPAQGEFASTTYFVTDDPEPKANVTHLSGEVSELALFSDGLERLALDFGARTAFVPFFSSLFQYLPAGSGRQKVLSGKLREFLGGPSVTEHTDDDKTLIMARRT
jgi:hypothetical protein